MQNAIVVNSIVKAFGTTRALRKLSFSSNSGINIILGPNGAGKSTLLRCIDGLYRVDSGTVSVLGTDPYRNDKLKEKLSLLTDNYALYDFLSVKDNLKFFGRLYGLKDSETLTKTRSIMKSLEAIEYLDKKVYQLSRGTKQKVAFCRAILNEPEVLLLDEPTAFLDAHAAEMVRRILFSYEKEGKTIVFVTQKLDEVTRFNGKISVIRNGSITRETTTEGLYSVVLRNTIVNIRLARPVSAAKAKGISGFQSANSNNATLLKFKVNNYKQINNIIRHMMDIGGNVVSVDYIEHLIDDLSG